jgi:asparagine synthetase B (glutamine-hydrolysing)
VRLREAGPVELGPTGLPVIPALEVAMGRPAGAVPLPRPPAHVEPDPVRALRDALLPALLRPPCVVAFSGGRDSSLLLAVAADLAARAGLDPPVALTFRYPGDAAADETSWQELVVTHLRGMRFDWERRDIGDELDLVGPLTGPVLRAHGGPVFPPALGNTILLAQLAGGGSLVTGNFGDEVLGGHRAAVLRAVARRRGRGLSAADRRHAVACAAPARVRLALGLRAVLDAPWLRPALREAVLAEALRGEAARPLRWDRSVRAVLAPRAVTVGNRTRGRVAHDHGCELVEPLGAPGFVASFAAFGGRWGRITRRAATQLLAGGLLPATVVDRRDKATFNASRFGAVSRAFARRWDGRGVDDDLVDPVALRAAWLADTPPATTGMLLQQAWLAAGEGSR